ncbi:hypothetical protein [Phosphitispora fastidiosa]|uniref:hypothetical protein n=1 Tax=Phosphitispora fastidiosa TaxID=2837202 RepID=UPI001E2952BA|nr:hypothetical protein [Phosphitispora fastidiosa]MBU7008446.1 hypothetical protein [Phosphitispora fastidiosa]
MRKNLPFLVLFVVVAVVIGGYLGYTSLNEEKTVIPENRDIKAVPPQIADDESDSGNKLQASERGSDLSPQTLKETDVENVDPKAGEMIVWGEVKAVDIDKRIITIDQEMDDNSVKISPNVAVKKDAVVRTKDDVSSLERIKAGDIVGAIITSDGNARAVLVNY